MYPPNCRVSGVGETLFRITAPAACLACLIERLPATEGGGEATCTEAATAIDARTDGGDWLRLSKVGDGFGEGEAFRRASMGAGPAEGERCFAALLAVCIELSRDGGDEAEGVNILSLAASAIARGLTADSIRWDGTANTAGWCTMDAGISPARPEIDSLLGADSTATAGSSRETCTTSASTGGKCTCPSAAAAASSFAGRSSTGEDDDSLRACTFPGASPSSCPLNFSARPTSWKSMWTEGRREADEGGAAETESAAAAGRAGSSGDVRSRSPTGEANPSFGDTGGEAGSGMSVAGEEACASSRRSDGCGLSGANEVKLILLSGREGPSLSASRSTDPARKNVAMRGVSPMCAFLGLLSD
jgi:hypothetical protein